MTPSIFSGLTDSPEGSFGNFIDTLHITPMALVDIFLVAAILYWLYSALRDTRALGIIYGIFVLIVAFVAANVFRLDLLAFLIRNFLLLLVVAIPVLFQPELRRLLERLGRLHAGTLIKRRQSENAIKQVSEAARIMAQSRTGALIVFKRATGLGDLITAGTELDAAITTPLLLNLFFDKSPLHDGAVIIDSDRLTAAGVMLPLSEKEYGYTLGARHRAAVGLTEQSDAVVLLVSEEKGIISLVVAGKITPGIKPDVLPQILTEFLASNHPSVVEKLRTNKAKKPKG